MGRRDAKNTWRSDEKIVGEAFKNVPICVLSGTKDTVIPAKHHNLIFALAVGTDETYPVSIVPEGKVNHVPRSNDVGTARLLIEGPVPHIFIMTYLGLASNFEPLRDFYR